MSAERPTLFNETLAAEICRRLADECDRRAVEEG